jgi:hypothetical protein
MALIHFGVVSELEMIKRQGGERNHIERKSHGERVLFGQVFRRSADDEAVIGHLPGATKG